MGVLERLVDRFALLLYDSFLLITRLFDNRVKSFINNILMSNDSVEHYSYRIEFQVRGLPHLHGVFWLKKEAIEKYDVVELIEKWISCSIHTNNPKLIKKLDLSGASIKCKNIFNGKEEDAPSH